MNSPDALPLAPSRTARRRFPFVAALLPVLLAFPPLTAGSRADEKAACPKGERRTEEGCIKDPQVIRRTPPVYPREALRQRVEGSVDLSARVMTDGQVDEIKVTSSSATDDRYLEAFEAAALTAVRKWRYSPGTVNGEPRAIYFKTTIDFKVNQSRSLFD